MSLTPASAESVYRDLGVFRRPIELLLSDFNNYFQQSSPSSVWEDETSFNIEVEVPGFTNDDLDIKLDNNLLVISGNRSRGGDSRRVLKSSVSYSYTIPRYVKMDEMSAVLANGILSIAAPKNLESRVRKIEVLSK